MTIPNVRIIPILIFIAVLSFSVRLVGVAQGVYTLFTPAQAEEKAAQEDHAEPAPTHDTAHDEKPKGEDIKPAAMPAPPGGEGVSKWRDPINENPAYEGVKMEVSADLAARREALSKFEQDLKTREALLKAAESEIDRKYQELAQLRKEIEGLLGEQSEQEKARISSLVKIYEGMKPKDAARIFDTLDLDVLVAVVSDMSERKLSPVLAAMDPERARTVTIMLAEQKQLPTLP